MRKRILAVASGGGHWVQLMRLRAAFAGHEVAYATVQRHYRHEIYPSRYYLIPDFTRRKPIALMRAAAQLLYILLRERPHIIVTTGSAPGLLAIALGQPFGAHAAWIDSIANVDELSMSGRLAGKYADLWLTQWPHLAKSGGPEYAGAVL